MNIKAKVDQRLHTKHYKNPYIRTGQEILVFALMIFILLCICAFSRRILTLGNITSIMRSFMEIGIIVLPVTFIVLTGGIDLSVGSVMALAAVIFGEVYKSSGNIVLAIFCALVTGIICGTINGFCVGFLNMPPMVVTLCGMYMFKGVALGISKAQTYSGFPDKFFFLGQGYILGMPTQITIFIVLIIFYSFLLTRTTYGKKIRAVGFNTTSARFSGINVGFTKMMAYILCNFTCALASLIYVSRVSIAKADAGMGYETDVITAIVLGGTSTIGGIGSIRGTVLGVMTIGLLRSGMTLINVTSDITSIIIGLILIVSIIISPLMDRYREKSRKT